MSLSESAIFNENSSYYVAVGTTSGVTSFNGATGDITLQTTPSSIAITGTGSNFSLTTDARPQAPSSVAATGAVSAGTTLSAPIITGSGFGSASPATPAGTATTALTLGSTGQFLNNVIGNTRIQGGAISVAANAGGGSITFSTPFSGIPLVYTSAAGNATTWVSSQSTTGCVINLPNPSASNVLYFLAIGAA
jgi:hypothetical protein